MNPNEEVELIKGKEKANENIKLQKSENNKISFYFFPKNPKNLLINIAILIILIIFIIIGIIVYIITNQPMKRFYRLLKVNPKTESLKANEKTKYDKSLLDENKVCSTNKKFAILRRTSCQACGLFSYYIVHLGCIINYLKHGYIPILEVGSFSNVFSGLKMPDNNPWEKFFNQPCGYTFNEVVKMKNVEIHECECVCDMPDEKTVYSNNIMWNYHHQIQEKYMSVKNEIYEEAENIWKNLFGDTKNVLGILLRGTDYTAIKPNEHAIPPTTQRAINDTINMNKQYKYDFIFLGTEDNKIRDKFIKKFGNKLKYLLPEKKVNYNYKNQNFLTFNYKVYRNLDFMKTYLLSVVILSKCVDIISARTSGAAGVFILSKGYRNQLVYYLGEYD